MDKLLLNTNTNLYSSADPTLSNHFGICHCDNTQPGMLPISWWGGIGIKDSEQRSTVISKVAVHACTRIPCIEEKEPLNKIF